MAFGKILIAGHGARLVVLSSPKFGWLYSSMEECHLSGCGFLKWNL